MPQSLWSSLGPYRVRYWGVRIGSTAAVLPTSPGIVLGTVLAVRFASRPIPGAGVELGLSQEAIKSPRFIVVLTSTQSSSCSPRRMPWYYYSCIYRC